LVYISFLPLNLVSYHLILQLSNLSRHLIAYNMLICR